MRANRLSQGKNGPTKPPAKLAPLAKASPPHVMSKTAPSPPAVAKSKSSIASKGNSATKAPSNGIGPDTIHSPIGKVLLHITQSPFQLLKPAATSTDLTTAESPSASASSRSFEAFSLNALGAAEYVALYFSAKWCIPCGKFLPLLVERFEAIRAKGHTLEMVYCSKDHTAEEFDAFALQQPWFSISFAAKAERNRLTRRFRVEALPCIVVLDAKGNIVNRNAVSMIRQQDSIERFPWKERSMLDILADAKIRNKHGEVVTIEHIKGLDTFALYFSASWCPPCRQFTPVLIEMYNAIKDDKATPAFASKSHDEGRRCNMEIFLVPWDTNESSWEEYYEKMPWASFAYGDPSGDELNKLFNVQGIPNLVTVNARSGAVINAQARTACVDDKLGGPEHYPWVPVPLADVVELSPDDAIVAALNDNACICINTNNDPESDVMIEAFTAAATTFCPKYKVKYAANPDAFAVTFFIVPRGGDDFEESRNLVYRVAAIAKCEDIPSVASQEPFVLAISLFGDSKASLLRGRRNITTANIISLATKFTSELNM